MCTFGKCFLELKVWNSSFDDNLNIISFFVNVSYLYGYKSTPMIWKSVIFEEHKMDTYFTRGIKL